MGHERNHLSKSNARNGYSKKQVLTGDGEFELSSPRDREGTFEPQLVKKYQTRITAMDSPILSLYAKGMTTREIVIIFKALYDAIAAVYPQTRIQRCIIDMVRNSLKYVSRKDYKAVTSDLKRIYQSATEEAALHALESFANTGDDKYPQISKSWYTHWQNLNTLFSYPTDICKAIYTTNAIGSLNSVIRQVIKKRKLFLTDHSVRKVIYLAIESASKKWNMPIRDWRAAMSRVMIEFEGRLDAFI